MQHLEARVERQKAKLEELQLALANAKVKRTEQWEKMQAEIEHWRAGVTEVRRLREERDDALQTARDANARYYAVLRRTHEAA